MQPMQRVGLAAARCELCGETAKPLLEHVIPADHPLVGEKLCALGIAPYDIVRIDTGETQITALLAGDRDAVLA
jgi:hypothetical protein